MHKGLVSSLLVALVAVVSCLPVRSANAQCTITTEAFDDPRLSNPRFFRSGDPDGEGPLPENFLLTHSTLADINSSRTQVIEGSTRTTLFTGPTPVDAVMYQGQWHTYVSGTSGTPPQGLCRWIGTTCVPITQIPGSILAFAEHAGELYFISLVGGAVPGQITRWNGTRAEIVGRFTTQTNFQVSAMESHGGSLCIIANFATVDGVAINRVAIFTPADVTALWKSPTFPSDIGTATPQSAASFQNTLYMVTNGASGSNFFRLSTATNSWEYVRDATTPTLGPASALGARLLSAGGYLYAVKGDDGFTNTGFTTPQTTGFLRWNGTHWLNMLGLANEWRVLRVTRNFFSTSTPIVRYRGQFACIANIPSYFSNGPIDPAITIWNGERFELLSKGPNGVVMDAAPFGEDTAVVGFFSVAGGVPVDGTARWDGETFHPIGPMPKAGWFSGGIGIYQIHSLNNDLFIAGDFRFGSGSQVSGLARWNGTDWVRGFVFGALTGQQYYWLDSYDSTLVASGNGGRAGEVRNGIATEATDFSRAILNHAGTFYVSGSTMVGIRSSNGTTQWLGQGQRNSSASPMRLLAFQDEIWGFGDWFFNSNNQRQSIIGRLLPNGAIVPAGAVEADPFSLYGLPTAFNGDVWAGGTFTLPIGLTRPIVRWNGIDMIVPSLSVAGIPLQQLYDRGQSSIVMPRPDGTNELWLNAVSRVLQTSPNSIILRYRASPPPLLTLQPTPSTACLGDTATFTFATQSNEGVTHAWRFNNLVLTDGSVAGLGVVSGARTTQLTITNLQTITGSIDALATTDCGTSYTIKVPVASGNACCDSIDFNNDQLFPTDEDLIDFFSVFAGGTCSNDPNCNDIDFNNDALFPSDDDLVAFLRVLAGGSC